MQCHGQQNLRPALQVDRPRSLSFARLPSCRCLHACMAESYIRLLLASKK